MRQLLLLVAFLASLSSIGCKVVHAQVPPTAGYVTYQSYTPSGACTYPNNLVVVSTTATAVGGTYQCMGTPLTWQQVGATAGVRSIDAQTGSFTFTGPGVSHDGTTYTFGGAGAGIGSIAWSLPSWLTANPATLSASGAQAFSATTGQTPHQVIGTCGAGTAFAPCALTPGDIPALPYLSSSTVLPSTVASTPAYFVTSYSADTGAFTTAQPAFADLSGSLGAAQGPTALTGILKDTAGALTTATPGVDYLSPSGSSAALSQATNSAYGVVKPDNTSITVAGGVVSAAPQIAGLTPSYLPKALTTNTIGDSGIDDGATTVDTVTVHEALRVSSGSAYSSSQLGVNVFSALPACAGALEGSSAPVTDSTTNVWGAAVAGGGTDHVLAYCDGTTWTVMAAKNP